MAIACPISMCWRRAIFRKIDTATLHNTAKIKYVIVYFPYFVSLDYSAYGCLNAQCATNKTPESSSVNGYAIRMSEQQRVGMIMIFAARRIPYLQSVMASSA